MSACKTNRREFFKTAASIGFSLPVAEGIVKPFAILASQSRSRVAQVLRKGITEGKALTSIDAMKIESLIPMIEEAVKAATGMADVQSAWMSRVSPKDVIGIKVNALAGPGMSTHPVVANAIAESLVRAGIPAGNIIIWDRLNRELVRCGYTLSNEAGRVRCIGSDSLPEPYERTPSVYRSIGSCFATLVSRYCTALINVPILKDHDLSGVSLGMKNLYGTIHNPNKYHDNHCSPYIADLSSYPALKNKLRLVIVDGLIGQYQGGPSLKPQWTFPSESILASTDPVAIDRVGALIIEKQREAKGLPSLEAENRPAVHIAAAASLGLGTDQVDEIQWIVAEG